MNGRGFGRDDRDRNYRDDRDGYKDRSGPRSADRPPRDNERRYDSGGGYGRHQPEEESTRPVINLTSTNKFEVLEDEN
jgi:hypothetical protein